MNKTIKRTKKILSCVLAITFALLPSSAWTQGKASSDGDSALVHVFMGSALDTDGDGLTDEVEATMNTDASNYDTDSDGLDDAWEVWNALDPVDPSDAENDEDGDGLTNYEEYTLDSLPFEADSDEDGFWDGVEFLHGTDMNAIDSYPYTGVYGDIDRDGDIDAMDIQLVINAALGIETSVPAEVDGVGTVNAIDIQSVINAGLGL